MSACHCQSCAPHAPAPTYPRFRHSRAGTRRYQWECFVRAVAAMPFWRRQGWLEGYGAKHGEFARARLEVAVRHARGAR